MKFLEWHSLTSIFLALHLFISIHFTENPLENRKHNENHNKNTMETENTTSVVLTFRICLSTDCLRCVQAAPWAMQSFGQLLERPRSIWVAPLAPWPFCWSVAFPWRCWRSWDAKPVMKAIKEQQYNKREAKQRNNTDNHTERYVSYRKVCNSHRVESWTNLRWIRDAFWALTGCVLVGHLASRLMGADGSMLHPKYMSKLLWSSLLLLLCIHQRIPVARRSVCSFRFENPTTASGLGARDTCHDFMSSIQNDVMYLKLPSRDRNCRTL